MIFIIFRENWTTCSQQRRRFLGLASSSTCPGATSPAGWDLNMLCDNWIFPVVLSWNLSARYLLQPGLPLTSFPLRWSQGRHQVEEPLKTAMRSTFFHTSFSVKSSTTKQPTSPPSEIAVTNLSWISAPCVEDPVVTKFFFNQLTKNAWFHSITGGVS